MKEFLVYIPNDKNNEIIPLLFYKTIHSVYIHNKGIADNSQLIVSNRLFGFGAKWDFPMR